MFHVKHCYSDLIGVNKSNNHNISSRNVSRETLDYSLAIYREHEEWFRQLVDLWLWWNKSINLFSRNTTSDLLKKHIQHSLILSCEINMEKGATYIDAGSGGGLPGLPMAMAYPASEFFLVDKIKKKQLVLRDIIRKFNLQNAEPQWMNIRDLRISKSVRIVSKHSFDLNDLINGLKNCNWETIHMLKGQDAFPEISNMLMDQFRVDIKRINIPGDPFFLDKYIVSIFKTLNNG